jgi:hypothetical protein
MKREYPTRAAVALGIAAILTLSFAPASYARAGSGGHHHGGHSAQSQHGASGGSARCGYTTWPDCKARNGSTKAD